MSTSTFQPPSSLFSDFQPSNLRYRVACIQLCSVPHISSSLSQAEQLIRKAALVGAKFILTPENTPRMATHHLPNKEIKTQNDDDIPFYEYNHPAVKLFSNLAKELNIYLLLGSIACKPEDPIPNDNRLVNRSILFSPFLSSEPITPTSSPGNIISRYDKIHMFDVPSLGVTEGYLESSKMRPGYKLSVIETNDLGKIGLSICYDLRFPHLYRTLAQSNVHLITVPAAFTVVTGQAHWHALLRARAIETACWILAPAQGGSHTKERSTYGHSLIINPWGEIIAECKHDQPDILIADINLEECTKARQRIPQLIHDRPFGVDFIRVKREKKKEDVGKSKL